MTADNGTQPPQNNAQNTPQQAGIQVLAQYIKDFSFENPNAPESLLAGWGAPDTHVDIALRHQTLRENVYECELRFKITAKKKDADKTAFIVELSYAATAALHNIPAENHQPIVMVELPKLLFPFAREIVAKTTASGGYPPLYLNPVNFEALYIHEMKRLQSEKENSQAAAN